MKWGAEIHPGVVLCFLQRRALICACSNIFSPRKFKKDSAFDFFFFVLGAFFFEKKKKGGGWSPGNFIGGGFWGGGKNLGG